VVAAVARRLGIDVVRSGASPQDKHAYVRDLQLRGRRVAMVGDGLNDAPVLAQADVSVAMGEGAALAQIHADVVLLSGRLGTLLAARQIAAGTMRVIRQNFGWALAYNAIALPLAVAGLIGPWEAAIGMTASSLVVVLNSGRFTARLR
jgi:Cu2+-exporting ATPase